MQLQTGVFVWAFENKAAEKMVAAVQSVTKAQIKLALSFCAPSSEL